MTEQAKPDAPTEDLDPMAKAVANGYVEPKAVSHEDRVAALIADVEHAMTHNTPISSAVFAEMKALLG